MAISCIDFRSSTIHKYFYIGGAWPEANTRVNNVSSLYSYFNYAGRACNNTCTIKDQIWKGRMEIYHYNVAV